jgi:DNA polymerase (family 10)
MPRTANGVELPHLVTVADIRGDLHVHTTASDGRASLAEMAQAAKERGYSYLAVTDHSKRVTIAHGLDANRLAEQVDDIARLKETLSNVVVLSSILEDAWLDLPNSILSRLAFAVGAVHSAFDLPRHKQTERLLRAMDNSRRAGPPDRSAYRRTRGLRYRSRRVLLGARERGCGIEVNGQPDRLDLDEGITSSPRNSGSSSCCPQTRTTQENSASCAMPSSRRDVVGWSQPTSSIPGASMAS